MREYKILQESDQYFLGCFGPEGDLLYRIMMADHDTAHQYKLALGLGTHPSPQSCPDYYEKVEDSSELYKIVIAYKQQEEESGVTACCQTGCPNCPWANG